MKNSRIHATWLIRAALCLAVAPALWPAAAIAAAEKVVSVEKVTAATDKAVTQIAFGCGFENLANFNRQFRRRRQVSPRQVRTRLESARLPD